MHRLKGLCDVDTPPKIFLSLPRTLFSRVEALALRLQQSPTQIVELALEDFLQQYPTQPEPVESREFASTRPARKINQGDLYWVERVDDSETPIPHPHVIIQDNLLNHSRIHTVVACALTSNLKRASLPGNVLLDSGEANLDKPSVVEVSKVSAIEKARLGDYIGTLTSQRIDQIWAGIRFLQTTYWDG